MTNLDCIKKTITTERDAINVMLNSLDDSLEELINILFNCKGHVIFIGIGKSGHIGKKLAATFASTGTPSFFIHGTEAMHGDFGMIKTEDICILISNSGNTQEITQDIEHIKKIGAKTVAFTSNRESILALNCDYQIVYPKVEEADPLKLAPTSSSTLTLVLGDAIASAIMYKRNFTKQDFYQYHPGGSLGRMLGGKNE